MLRLLRRPAVLVAATLVAGAGGAGLPAAGAQANGVPANGVPGARSAQVATVPTLVGIRAAHHRGFDRVVLDFAGPLPAHRSYRWVSRVVQDGSGRPVRIAGHAFLQTVFSVADAHDAGGATVPRRRTFALPNLTQVVVNGDFEGYVSVALGLQRRTTVRHFVLTSPSRVVVDVTTPYTWYRRNVYFLDVDRYAAGTRPYTIAVRRPVIPPALARQALERLYAGPTRAERAAGLRFVASRTTGFTDLSISGGIARLRLTGGCSSGGSTYTVANEIFPTLKQFATVDHVKIYGPAGYTERPGGDVDSIPPCLEP